MDSTRGPATAPSTPVSTVSAAVSSGSPPEDSDSAMAIGVVADFGAMEMARVLLPPKARVTVMATTTALTAPLTRQTPIGSQARLMWRAWRDNGQGKAPLSGP